MAMDEKVPDWLTNEFLTQCLQKEEVKQDIEVIDFVVSPVVPPGNNYGSFIIRVKVEYKTKTVDSELRSTSLVIKSELTEGAVKESFDNVSVLQQCEYDFYYKFLPEAEKITNTGFAPKCFFSPINKVTILEDLKEKGFVMADRVKQLDFDHCRLYMEAAASLHATSFAIHKVNPYLIESVGKEKMFSNELGHGMFTTMIKGGMEVLADSTMKIPRFQEYAKVIRAAAPLLWEKIIEIHKPSEVINTINQGDPWTTNMMFKYDEMGSVCEVKLIDFQCLRYGSPFNDLVFFIWLSANNFVKSHKLDELYQIYLETFNSKLEQLHCTERLTYEHLNESMKKLSPLAIFQVAALLPLLIHPDPVDFGKFVPKGNDNNDELVLSYFKNFYDKKYCEEQVPHLLEQLENAGVFEYLESLINK